MRTVPTALNTELCKEVNFLGNLVELYLSSTLCYTNIDLDFWYGGKLYSSRKLMIDNIGYTVTGQIDSTDIIFDNSNLEFSTLVLGQETRGKKAIIKLAGFTDPLTVVGTSIQFTGIIDSCQVDNKSCTFNILNPWIFWGKKIPRRFPMPSCPWTFKGPECYYSGALSWCDQSYDRCLAVGNTVNFGGFRWMPSLINKQVWWGRA